MNQSFFAYLRFSTLYKRFAHQWLHTLAMDHAQTTLSFHRYLQTPEDWKRFLDFMDRFKSFHVKMWIYKGDEEMECEIENLHLYRFSCMFKFYVVRGFEFEVEVTIRKFQSDDF